MGCVKGAESVWFWRSQAMVEPKLKKDGCMAWQDGQQVGTRSR